MTVFDQIIEAIDQHNTHDVMRLIVPYKNTIEANAFLTRAVLRDNTDAVRCIIPFVNMTDNYCLGLVNDEHSEIFELLYQTSDPQYVIDKMTNMINDTNSIYHHINREGCAHMIDVIGQRLKADREQQILNEEVGDKPSGPRSKM